MGYSPEGRTESGTTERLNNSSSYLAPGSFLAVCAGDGVEIVSKSSSFIQIHVLNNTFKAHAGPSGSKVEEHALTFKYPGVWREEKKSAVGGGEGGHQGSTAKGDGHRHDDELNQQFSRHHHTPCPALKPACCCC